MNKTIFDALTRIEDGMNELAHSSCIRASGDPFITGLQAGKYQGLMMAKDIMTSALDDEQQKLNQL